VIDNIALGLLYQGIPTRERRARARTAADQVGLGHRRHARCSTLSGGEKQRVAIARALANEPTLLFADEPTGALDSKTGVQIIQLLEELNRSGMTIVMVTHDEKIAQHAQRVMVMRDGRFQ
jgi:putative ABC transport system ATP-binding protein